MADQTRTIQIPVHPNEVTNTWGHLKRELLQELGREPTIEELARAMGITPNKGAGDPALRPGIPLAVI